MSPLKTIVRWELKRMLANICRAYEAEGKPLPDQLAVRLTIIDELRTLKLAEVQDEDKERKHGQARPGAV